MGAGEFHGRVRDGIGCRLPAKATRSSNPPQWKLLICKSSVNPATGVEGSGGVLCAQPRLRLFSVTLANGVQLAGADCGRPGVSEDDFHAWCLF
jgi:hypothetical protein